MHIRNRVLIVLSISCVSLSAQVFQPGVDPHSKDILVKEYADLAGDIEQSLKERAADLQSDPDPVPQSPESKVIRAMKTRLWLRLLADIDKLRDPSFNFEDRPTMHVMPPPSVNPSNTVFSGMDPSGISDPEIRRQYEEAIRENNEKATRYHLQLRLKLTDEQYTPQAVQYLTSTYDKTPGDAHELIGAVDAILSSQARKDQMTKALHEILSVTPQPSKEQSEFGVRSNH
jgi:hypothetical protein